MTEIPIHVCGDCGCINVAAQDRIAMLEEQLTVVTEDRDSLERDMRGKRSVIKRLKAEQDKSLHNHPRYDEAMQVLKHWKDVCSPQARELGGPRLRNVLARLDGNYTGEQLKRSADGYALKPYVTNGRRSPTGAKDDWHADAELIYRDPQKVDQGLRIAEQADVLRDAMQAQPAQVASTVPNLTPKLSDLGEAALRVVNAGWHVFPVRALGKAPASPNGFLDATLAVDRIEKAWSSHPDLNIGIRCGKESNLIVLDVDPDKDGDDSLHDLVKEYEDLPPTLTVQTPRLGMHYYFQHPGIEIANTANFPLPGLDIRGDGGYVLAPPSYVKDEQKGIDGPYVVDEQTWPAPIPKWLLKLLLNRQEKQSDLKARDWGAFINDGLTEGERNHRMTQYVGHMFQRGHDAGEVFEHAKILNAQKVKPPMDLREIEATVKSIQRREIRKATT